MHSKFEFRTIYIKIKQTILGPEKNDDDVTWCLLFFCRLLWNFDILFFSQKNWIQPRKDWWFECSRFSIFSGLFSNNTHTFKTWIVVKTHFSTQKTIIGSFHKQNENRDVYTNKRKWTKKKNCREMVVFYLLLFLFFFLLLIAKENVSHGTESEIDKSYTYINKEREIEITRWR